MWFRVLAAVCVGAFFCLSQAPVRISVCKFHHTVYLTLPFHICRMQPEIATSGRAKEIQNEKLMTWGEKIKLKCSGLLEEQLLQRFQARCHCFDKLVKRLGACHLHPAQATSARSHLRLPHSGRSG